MDFKNSETKETGKKRCTHYGSGYAYHNSSKRCT